MREERVLSYKSRTPTALNYLFINKNINVNVYLVYVHTLLQVAARNICVLICGPILYVCKYIYLGKHKGMDIFISIYIFKPTFMQEREYMGMCL